jgi:hypothetical protein
VLELSRPAVRYVATIVVAVVCMSGSGSAVAGRATPIAARNVPVADRIAPVLRVHGRVIGLFPGARKRMRVTVRNTGRSTLVVTSITVRVDDASSACPGTNVRIRPFSGRVRVRASGSVMILLRARMPRSVPDACQGARFSLRFSARAIAP